MFARITLALAIGFATLTAQTLPDRPEKLNFPQLVFQVPKAKDFKTRLRNNIPVYLSDNDTNAPIVRLSIQWKGGRYMEPSGKEGLVGFFGLLSQGGSTKMELTKQEDLLEDLAASIVSACSDTSGAISMQCLEKDFSTVFGMMMDTFTQPAFPQDRLELAKRNAKQSLERINDSVPAIASYQMGYLLMGEDHFTVRSATPASIDSITREDLLAFHSRILHPSNFIVTVSGKFNRRAVLDRLNTTLGSMRPTKDAQVSPRVPAPEFTRIPGIYVVNAAAPQAMVQWAFPGMRRSDTDWHAASVMNHILGGSFTSRLMKKIRSDEGLTYGIRTSLSEGAHWNGDLSGNSQLSNNNVAYLLRLAIAEMETLKNVPLTNAELQPIKDGLIESFPSRWNRSTIVSTLASEAMAGWPEDWWVDYREKIQAVTPDDVQRMAKRLLDMNKVIILAVGQANLMEAGNPDHPGLLKDILPLPMQRLPLRNPNTGKPM